MPKPRTAPSPKRCRHLIVVLGDQDFSVPATVLASSFARSRLVTLKGVDHFRTPEAFAFIDVVMETFAA